MKKLTLILLLFIASAINAQSWMLTLGPDIYAPGIPSSFTATGDTVAIVLTWTDPIEHDLDSIKIYAGTDSASAALLTTVAAGVQTYIDSTQSDSSKTFYAIAQDIDGNTSDPTASSSASGIIWGSELVLNGDMEDLTGWAVYGQEVGDTSYQSSTRKHGGTYSQYINVDANGEGVKCALFSVDSGATYKVSVWHYNESGIFWIQRGSNRIPMSTTSAVTGAWTEVADTLAATSTGTEQFRYQSSGGAAEFYIDDATVKKRLY